MSSNVLYSVLVVFVAAVLLRRYETAVGTP
jgi:hypothetical protein